MGAPPFMFLFIALAITKKAFVNICVQIFFVDLCFYLSQYILFGMAKIYV